MIEFPHYFLDDNAYLLVSNFRKSHVEQYKVIILIAELMRKIIDDDECKNTSNDRNTYIICTVYDCYATYSSEILLLERGLVSDFYVLFRTFYEKKFKLFAVIRNKKYYDKLHDEQEYYTTALAKQVIENEHHMFDDFIGKIKKDDYDFDAYESKKMSVEAWANNAKLACEYKRQYALLSLKTHYSINSLIEKLEKNEQGDITYLSFSYDDFDENFVIASMEMLVCIDKFLHFINCEKYNEEIKKINERIEVIVKKIEKERM